MVRKGVYKTVRMVGPCYMDEIGEKIEDVIDEMEDLQWALDCCQLIDQTSFYACLTFVKIVCDE